MSTDVTHDFDLVAEQHIDKFRRVDLAEARKEYEAPASGGYVLTREQPDSIASAKAAALAEKSVDALRRVNERVIAETRAEETNLRAYLNIDPRSALALAKASASVAEAKAKCEAQHTPLKVGDVVYLKSGSPKMTVSALRGEAIVSWFDGTKEMNSHYPLDCLTRTNPARSPWDIYRRL